MRDWATSDEKNCVTMAPLDMFFSSLQLGEVEGKRGNHERAVSAIISTSTKALTQNFFLLTPYEPETACGWSVNERPLPLPCQSAPATSALKSEGLFGVIAEFVPKRTLSAGMIPRLDWRLSSSGTIMERVP